MSDWQKERSRLNHGWLGNTILNRLAVWVAEGPEIDELADVEQVLAEWERYHSDLHHLILAFESEESPSAVLNSPPFSFIRSSDREWLAQVSQMCWACRIELERIVDEASTSYNICCERYKKVKRCFGKLRAILTDSQNLAPQESDIKGSSNQFRCELKEFLSSVRLLSASISAFPYDAHKF